MDLQYLQHKSYYHKYVGDSGDTPCKYGQALAQDRLPVQMLDLLQL